METDIEECEELEATALEQARLTLADAAGAREELVLLDESRNPDLIDLRERK